ncbi:MAG: hypothetical protein M3384_21745 [Acidobacteriota bacterium]|nr:hypothetical protein [Acidobacteriota bacterium]
MTLNSKEISVSRDPFSDSHPLDYDWRFTKKTTKRLANLVKNSKSVLLLGCPSLALELNDKTDYTLVDIQPFDEDLFRGEVINADLTKSLAILNRKFETGFADPPWYPAYFCQWIKVLLNNIEIGGKLFLTIWKNDIRPDAPVERDLILRKLMPVGDIKIHSDFILYVIPTFEKKVFSVLGKRKTRNWRRGDLIELTLKTPEKWENCSISLDYQLWHRYILNNSQIAIRDTEYKNDAAPDIKKVKGQSSWFLNTFSRRDYIKTTIDIWTSEGFAGTLENGSSFIKYLDLLVLSNSNNIPQESLDFNTKGAKNVLEKLNILPKPPYWRKKKWKSQS